MPNELPIPPEWQHLIEKRTGEERRSAGRKSGEAKSSAGTGAEQPAVERRRGDRRQRK